MIRKMLFSVFIIILLYIGTTVILGNNNAVEENLVVLTYEISLPSIKIKYFNNFTFLIAENASYPQKAGDPALPILNYIVIIPLDSNIVNVETTIIEKSKFVLEKPVFPHPKPIPLCSCRSRENKYLNYNFSVYPVDILVDKQLLPFRGMGLLNLHISPVIYYPLNKTLVVIKRIRIKIAYSYSYKADEIARKYSPAKILRYLPNVLNRDVKSIPVKKLPVSKKTTLDLKSLSIMNYDEVVIAPSDWNTTLNPLINWKFKKGIPTYLATLEMIDANYNGVDLAQKIRNFIKDAFNTWQITRVLLVGDVNIIPTRYIFNPDDDEGGWFSDNTYKPTDRYYGGLSIDALYGSDDGWYAYSSTYGWGWGYSSAVADDGKDHIQWSQDVIVSRIPVNTVSELTDYISKLLNYEKQPKIGNWTERMMLVGAVLETNPVSSAVEYKEALRTDILENNMTYYKLYNLDGVNSNLTRDNFVNALNSSGVSLTEWFAHGGTYLASDLVYNEGAWQWYNFALASDALSMSNNDTLTFIFAYSCLTNAFDAAEYNGVTYNGYSLGEAFVRNANGGAIGYIGWARTTWGYLGPYLDLGGGESIDTYFWAYLFTVGNYTPGLSLFQSLNRYGSYYSSSEEWRRKVYTSIHLLGDLDLSVWTNIPLSMSVSHPNEVYAGSDITIIAEPYSMVTLYNSETGFYSRKYTNSSGVAVFSAPDNATSLEITVTKHGYLPYESIIDVLPPAGFWIELNITSVKVWRDGIAVIEVYVKANDVVGNVTISANTTSWLLAEFNPSVGTPNYTSILTLTILEDAPIGNYTLEVKGESPSGVSTAFLNIAIQDFELELEKDKLVLLSNSSTVLNITVESLNGFNGQVNLTYTLSPDTPTIQISLNPESGYAPYSSIANITTINTAEGNYSLVIKGIREDGKFKEKEIQLTVIESVTIRLELESIVVTNGIIEVNFTITCEEGLPITTAEYYVDDSFIGNAEPEDGEFDESEENATIRYDAKYLDDGFHTLSIRGCVESYYSNWLNLSIHVRTLNPRYSIVAPIISPIGPYKASDMAKAIGPNLAGIWRWDVNLQDFVAYVPGVSEEDFEIVMGEGYFIYMNDYGKWVEVGMP